MVLTRHGWWEADQHSGQFENVLVFFFCTFICSYLEFTPAYCIYVKRWLKQNVMVLKRGSWETRLKHWSLNLNCICFVFVFASNTLQAKVRPSIVWSNVSVLVKKSSDPTQINASAVMKMPEHFWRTTTQRRCYTPPPVLAQPPCHKMSGIWLHPPRRLTWASSLFRKLQFSVPTALQNCSAGSILGRK